MPYVNVRITKTGVTAAQKAEVIKGVTEILVKVQTMADGGQEMLYAIPLLIEGAAAK